MGHGSHGDKFQPQVGRAELGVKYSRIQEDTLKNQKLSNGTKNFRLEEAFPLLHQSMINYSVAVMFWNPSQVLGVNEHRHPAWSPFLL
jgi:hypothetical protein